MNLTIVLGKILKLFICLFFLSFITHAKQDYYVKVSTVQSKKNLTYIEEALKSFGYKSHYTQDKGSFTIFAGPFKNNTQANQAVTKIINGFSKPKNLKVKEIKAPKNQEQKYLAYLRRQGSIT